MKLLMLPALIFSACLLMVVPLLTVARQKPPQDAWLYFISRRDGRDEVYRMWNDGNHPHRITDIDAGRRMQPEVSPDGRYLLLVSNHLRAPDGAGNDDIFRLDLETGAMLRLTDDPAFDGQPAWSPDGRSIAFTSYREGDGEIYLMNPDGSDQRLLVSRLDDELSPTWSPDSQQIAFVSIRNGNSSIFVVDADGNNLRGLVRNVAYIGMPAWSPDGDWLALTASVDGTYHIYRVHSTEQGNFAQLTPDGSGFGYFDPQWSPDGESLAFWVRDGFSTFAVYRMSSDGDTLTQLTPFSDNLSPTWGKLRGLDWNPLWGGLVALGIIGAVGVRWRMRDHGAV